MTDEKPKGYKPGIQERIEDCRPHADPMQRPDYTEAEVQAVRALQRGEATERQQVLALEYMIRAAGTHDQSYRPGDPHATAFAEGRRWVGNTLIWMLKTAPTTTDPDKISTREPTNVRTRRKS